MSLVVVLALLGALLTSSPCVEGHPKPPSTNITVIGTVFCDACSNNKFSEHSYFLQGVKVQLECNFRANWTSKEEISVTADRTTDRYGVYRLDIPPVDGFECEEGRAMESFCRATLVENSSSPSCNVPNLRTSTEHVALNCKKPSACLYNLNALSYRPAKKDTNLCGTNIEIESNTVNEGLFFFWPPCPPFGFPWSHWPPLPFPWPFTPPSPSFPLPWPFTPPSSPSFPLPWPFTPPSPPSFPFPWPFAPPSPPPFPVPLPPFPFLTPPPPPPPSFPFPFPPLPPFTPIPPLFAPPPPPSFPFPFPPLPPFTPTPPLFAPPPPPSPPPPVLPFPFPPLPPLFPSPATPTPPPPYSSLGDPRSWFPFKPPPSPNHP